MKIQAKFIIFGKTVLFVVWYQTRKFWKGYSTNTLFHASNGFAIKSANRPELTTSVIYIKGESSSFEQPEITIKRFDSEDEAAQYIQRAELALKEWAASEMTGKGPERADKELLQFDVCDVTF